MAATYTKLLAHCVFSTKGRRNSISSDVHPRLWAYIGGIARENGFAALAVGGVNDHVHVLLWLPATMPVSKALQLIKAGSSKWLRDAFPAMRSFAWQAGYGAFSIGMSQVADTVSYIRNQPEHHRTRSFADEYRAFLEKSGIEYDERYVLD